MRNFEKLFLISLALGISVSGSVKAEPATVNRRAHTYFPKGSGAILNMDLDEFEKAMLNED